MTVFSLPYGKTHLDFELPQGLPVDVLAPPAVAADPDPFQAVSNALEQPLDGAGLADFQGARTAALAVNDKTRPVPHQYLLPPLLKRLEALGIPAENIRLYIASGAHPPMVESEFAAILPDAVLRRHPVVSHDCDDAAGLEFIGLTSRGTPIWVNRAYLQADIRLVVGNIAPHQFQGFSGGVKSAAIGLAGRETINRNHALMMEAGARLGRFETNPARQDVEEIGARLGVHLALNAVLNEKKEIVRVLFGGPQAVMQAGMPLARQICQIAVGQLYDLVIVSCGGHPNDINLYQSQKGLAHAALVTKKGGAMILAAACVQGSGSSSYERWVRHVGSFDELFDRFRREGFRVGPHKAYQIARDASQIRLQLVSEMPADLVRNLLLRPAPDLQTAVDAALAGLPDAARIGLMPMANATIPMLEQPAADSLKGW